MIKKTAIILAAMALSVSMASAVTIQEIYDGGGSHQIGDKVFSNFTVVGADAGEVSVGGIVGADYVDIIFSGPFTHLGTGSSDFTLLFKVSVVDPGWVITSIGQALAGAAGNPAAYAQIDEAVFSVPGPIGGDKLANSTVTWDLDPSDPDLGLPEFGDNLVLSTPSSTIWVKKDILLVGGNLRDESCGVTQECALFASATSITQRFYQRDDSDVPDVPEPATMLLFSTALLGLGFMRRKKS